MSLKEDIAIVTGGASGIGESTVKKFHAKGATVVIADSNIAAAKRLAATLGEEKALAVELDVNDDESISSMLSEVESAFGVPNHLVNSAGIREIIPAMELSMDDWDGVMGVNLRGLFRVCQLFSKRLMQIGEGGSIVNISSTASIQAVRNRAAYVASKHGVVGLTKQLALELGPSNIRVNAVAPSVTRTPLTEKYFDSQASTETYIARYPLGRICTPEEVASAIVFLASDEASFISGVNLPVDGGYSAGRLN